MRRRLLPAAAIAFLVVVGFLQVAVVADQDHVVPGGALDDGLDQRLDPPGLLAALVPRTAVPGEVQVTVVPSGSVIIIR